MKAFLKGHGTIGMDDSGNPFASLNGYIFTITPRQIHMTDEDGETIVSIHLESGEVETDLSRVEEVEVYGHGKEEIFRIITANDRVGFEISIDKEQGNVSILQGEFLAVIELP